MMKKNNDNTVLDLLKIKDHNIKIKRSYLLLVTMMYRNC